MNMWKLNSLANKAAEAVRSAKKGIEDIAKESNAGKNEDKTDELVKAQCAKYRQKIIQINQENEKLKEKLGQVGKEQDLIKFKIVIGRLEPDDLAFESEAEGFKDKCEKMEKEIVEKDQVIRDLNEKMKKLQGEGHGKDLRIEELVKIYEECRRGSEDLKDLHEKLIKRTKSVVKELFDSVKKSFGILGLNMPSIDLQSAGLEDLQEFITTQNGFIQDCIGEMKQVSVQIGKNVESFSDCRVIYIDALKQFQVILKEEDDYKEKIKKFEGLVEKVNKEKDDLGKNNKKLTERVKILFEEVKKNNDVLKENERLKDEKLLLDRKITENNRKIEDLIQENKSINDVRKNIEEKVREFSEKNEKISKDFENLKKRFNSLNSQLSAKEKLLKDLEDEKKNIILESQDYRKNQESELLKLKNKHLNDQKLTQELNDKTIQEITKKLKETQNELKDTKIENIQLSNQLKKINEIEKSYSSLITQNERNIERIKEINKENETLREKLKKVESENDLIEEELNEFKGKIQDLEHENENLNMKIGQLDNVNLGLSKELELNCLKLKSKEGLLAGMIDKRMIGTFLVNFLNDKNSANAKKQMLRAMTEVLEMTNEQKEKIVLNTEQSFYSHFKGYLTR